MSDVIASVAGVLLSLAASYIPGVANWYAQLQPDQRRLIMLVALALSSVTIYAASCAGWTDAVACDRGGASSILRAFIVALISNQSAYAITPGVSRR